MVESGKVGFINIAKREDGHLMSKRVPANGNKVAVDSKIGYVYRLLPMACIILPHNITYIYELNIGDV